MDDINAQQAQAEAQILELENEYIESAEKQLVSPRAKVLTHQVIESESNILDQIAFRLWCIKVSPKLPEDKRKVAEKNIVFPVGKDEQSFKSSLGKWGKIEEIDKEVLEFLSNLQPYNTRDNWLFDLKSLARQKHIGLIPQKMTTITHVEYSSGVGSVHFISENITFGPAVSILGAPIDPVTKRIVSTHGVKEDIEKWNSFILEGYNLDALSFCKGSLERVMNIVASAKNKFGALGYLIENKTSVL